MLSPCRKQNSKLDIKDKEEETLFCHKASTAQVCLFKLQLIDLRLRLLPETFTQSNQNLLKRSLNLLLKKRKLMTPLFQKVEKRTRRQPRKSQLLSEYHQHNTKSLSKLVFQRMRFQSFKPHNIG
jgi:hypothetical protein